MNECLVLVTMSYSNCCVCIAPTVQRMHYSRGTDEKKCMISFLFFIMAKIYIVVVEYRCLVRDPTGKWPADLKLRLFSRLTNGCGVGYKQLTYRSINFRNFYRFRSNIFDDILSNNETILCPKERPPFQCVKFLTFSPDEESISI